MLTSHCFDSIKITSDCFDDTVNDNRMIIALAFL